MMVATFVDRCASNAVIHGQHSGHLGCCGFADCPGVNSIVHLPFDVKLHVGSQY